MPKIEDVRGCSSTVGLSDAIDTELVVVLRFTSQDVDALTTAAREHGHHSLEREIIERLTVASNTSTMIVHG